MALKLRPYQQSIIDEARALMQKGHRSILICSPTGSGKTALTVSMLGAAAKKGKRSLFNVHRRELVKQSSASFYKGDIPHGIISSNFPGDLTERVQIASVQTLPRRMHKYPDPDLIVWDECHHIAAGSWQKIFNAYPNSFHIGLTATPERLDGKGLADFFKVMVRGPGVSWLIENEFLSDYKLFVSQQVSTQGIRTQMGDFKRSDLDEAMDKPTITGSAINEYKKRANGKRAVVFCVSIKHSTRVVDQFNSAGIKALHVDGETPTEERDRAIEMFAKGDIQILSNVDLFGEGFDLPSIEVSILLRPTKSLSLYLQQVGRALRPYPGKTHAVILDHAGNAQRHGLPDEERMWNLNGRDKKQASNKESLSIKTCDNCFAAQPPGSTECRYCGHKFEIQERKIEEVDGHLVEFDRKMKIQENKKQQGRAQSLEELTELGRQRGYKRPRMWAKHVFNARQAKRFK